MAECYSVTPSCSQLYRALTLPQRKTLHRLFPAELFFQGIKDHFMKYKVLHTHAMVQHECFQKNLGRSRKNMIKPALTPPTDKVAAHHQTDTSKTKAIVNFDVSDKDILLDVGRPFKELLSICLRLGWVLIGGMLLTFSILYCYLSILLLIIWSYSDFVKTLNKHDLHSQVTTQEC